MHTKLINFKHKIENYSLFSDGLERNEGLSVASLHFLDDPQKPAHLFLAFLEPLANGAAFSGFKVKGNFNLSSSSNLCLDIESVNHKTSYYQLFLQTTNAENKGFSYTSQFCLESNSRSNVKLALNTFTAVRRGKPFPITNPINLKEITAIGIRIIGRASEEIRQHGIYGIKLYSLLAN